MEKYRNNVVDRNGNVLPGASVLVKTYPAGTTATIYSDNGVTSVNNPLTTDAYGQFAFYAADGRYSLTISGSNITTYTIDDIPLLEDPADGSAALADPSGASLVGFIQAGTGAVARTVQDKERETISSEDFSLAGETTQDLQLQRAIDYAISSGKKRVTLNTPHTLNGPVTIASNTNPLIVDGNGVKITLDDNTAGFIIKGLRHHLRCMEFAQPNLSLTPTAIKVTADATYTNTQHTKLEFLRGVNVYRGIQATMPSPAQVCYRTHIINCEFENFNLQKTWPGSFGFSFDGPTAGNAAGNDSDITGGLVKGYEKNVIVQNSVGMEINDLSNDLGGVGIRYDGGSHLRVIGGYNEYSDTIIEAVNNPTYLYWFAPTVSNYTNFLTGTINQIVVGQPPIGGFTGGGVDFVTGPWKSTVGGVAEAYATNGVKIGDLSGIANVAAIKGIYTTTLTHSFGSIAAGGNANTGAVSVPGATANSMVNVTCINGSLPNGSLGFFGTPSGSNTIIVFCQNVANGAITADNLQLRITVFEF